MEFTRLFLGYENIDEFLKDPNPVEYDFKYQLGQKIKGVKKPFKKENGYQMLGCTNTIERLFRYKDYNYTYNFDCDGNKNCQLSLDIYEKLWNQQNNAGSKERKKADEESSKEPQKAERPKSYKGLSINSHNNFDKNIIFSPDTMNSFVKRYREITESDEYSGFESVNEAYDKLSRFAVLTHTIGNFCLVPKGFNTHRNAMQNDFWDLSLLELKTKGFKKFKPEHFKQYIDTFFLWDYVDTNYEPLSLFLSNDDFKGKNGKGKDDRSKYNNFLENVEYAITNRGKFMVYMLNHEDKLKKFKGKLNSDYDFFAMYNKFLESGELTFDLRMQ